jgi:hypothetical protein
MDARDFIAADPVATQVLDLLCVELLTWEGVTRTDQRSQIQFKRVHSFAALWVPQQYLKRELAPVVLTIMTRRRIRSKRFKEVAKPASGHFVHHLENSSPRTLDKHVFSWLERAWEDAC